MIRMCRGILFRSAGFWPGSAAVVFLATAACSPVWFLTRSDEVAILLSLEEKNVQSTSFTPKFPGHRYRVFLRFDRTVSFEEVKCLVGDLLEDRCAVPPVPVQFQWMVSLGDAPVVQGNAAPRFARVAWTDAYVEVVLGEFYPEHAQLYTLAARVTGDGGRLRELRPKLLVLSYYNPLDRSIHVGPGGDPEPLPNNRINLTALRAARYPGRWAAAEVP